jgi:tRNA (cytidine/uridine-2'-O-)-methyltransferase
MRLALYQPEIPQNTGTLLRLGACLNVPVDIIEPCGFIWHDQKLRRAGMDYLDLSQVTRHASWSAFREAYPDKRLLLIDAKGSTSYIDFAFSPDDILLMGQESCGVPIEIMEEIPISLRIPMAPERRSLNVAVAASMVVGEALRQTNLFP